MHSSSSTVLGADVHCSSCRASPCMMDCTAAVVDMLQQQSHV
jgi:hypothetical protein